MSDLVAETLLEWREAFIQDLRVRGYSPMTIEGYSRELGRLFDWLKAETELTSVADLTSHVLRNFQIHLMLKPRQAKANRPPRVLTAGSRNRILASIKSFFRYLRKSGRLLSNPAAELDAARKMTRLPKDLLTVAEMRRLLDSIDPTTDVGCHDRAVFELLYSSGLRRGEFQGLQLRDLRLEEGFAHVLGKGNKERIVPIGTRALRALQIYLAQVRPLWARPDCPYVFVSKALGQPYHGQKLLARLRGYAKAAKIRKPVTFHGFRHTCATHLLQGKADLRSIQLLLGHAKLDVTAQYLHVDPSHLRALILEHHPRENEALWSDEVDPPEGA